MKFIYTVSIIVLKDIEIYSRKEFSYSVGIEVKIYFYLKQLND